MALKGKVHDNKVSVFLGNLHFNTTEEDIRLLFSKVTFGFFKGVLFD